MVSLSRFWVKILNTLFNLFQLRWQRYSRWYNDLLILWECFTQIGLDSSCGELDIFLRGCQSGVSYHLLNDVDIHAKVSKSCDAAASGCMDCNMLASSNLAHGKQITQATVDSCVAPEWINQIFDGLVPTEDLHGSAIEDDAQGNLYQFSSLRCRDA